MQIDFPLHQQVQNEIHIRVLMMYLTLPPCRADEEAFVSDRDDSTGGHDWERVCRMCDFNPKGTKNTKDVSRMRSIFLQLKQTPLAKE